MTITFLTDPPSSLHIGLDGDQSDQRLADRLATAEKPSEKAALLDAFEVAFAAQVNTSRDAAAKLEAIKAAVVAGNEAVIIEHLDDLKLDDKQRAIAEAQAAFDAAKARLEEVTGAEVSDAIKR